jgi:ATP-binding cassette subfamily B protein
MPVYVKETVDNLMGTTKVTGLETAIWLSLKLGGIYILLSFLKGFFLFLMRQTIIIMSRLIEFDLKNEIFQHYQRLDMAFFKRNSTGDLMNRISEDVGLVRMYLGPGIMYTINLVILSSMIIFQMTQISAKLTLFVLLPLPVMSFLIYKVSTKINKMSKLVQEEQSLLSTIAQETFAGIRIIKAYNRNEETGQKFSNSTHEYQKRSMKLVLINALFLPTIIFLIGISTLITIYLGGLMTYEKQISLGGIVAFVFFVNNLTWPFASVGWVTSIIQRAAASQNRINDFLETKPEFENSNHEEFDFKGEIEFKNVSFTYPDTGIKALDCIRFKIKKGDTLAIVGRTGSGKSTILQLLLRQYHCDSGEILIDGKNLQEINSDAFRDQSGIVPQDVFLFSDTIANNLKFGSKVSTITNENHV